MHIRNSPAEILGKLIRINRVLTMSMGSKEELAAKANVPVQVITWLEKGEGEKPDRSFAERVLDTFKLTDRPRRYLQGLLNTVFEPSTIPVVKAPLAAWQPPIRWRRDTQFHR